MPITQNIEKITADSRPTAPVRGRALAATSAAALLLTVAPGTFQLAQAQSDSTGAASVEQVTVSASRITTAGFEAPTPTTVIGAADLQTQAQDNIFSAIAQLPALMGSQGTSSGTPNTSSGDNGLSSFGMRGLGAIRTLVLVDGQRIVPAYVTGISDVSLLPQLLIKRVDVVTGGASASWGSDAVAGVVNFVTDKKFSGVKGNIEGGITTYGDDANGLLQLAAGTDLFGGRGHIEGSIEYGYEAGIPGSSQHFGPYLAGGRTWFSGGYAAIMKYPTIASIPAGQPQYNVVHNGQNIQYVNGGIIDAGPLQGTAFGTNGTPYPFNYGVGLNGQKCVPNKDSAGTVQNGLAPWCVGGDVSGDLAEVSPVASLNRFTDYLRFSYDVTPDLNVWASMNFGDVRTHGTPSPFFETAVPIKCGNAAGGPNAFLPASVNQACANANVTSFSLGTGNTNIPDLRDLWTQRDERRYVAGADGAYGLLGTDWTWDSYFEHGESNTDIRIHVLLNPYYLDAVDSVAGPGGTIVCRSAQAQAAGCVPFDPFGNAVPTQASLNWIFGGPHQTNGRGPQQLTHEKQDAFSISTNGQPFSDWAGPVSVAYGFDYRNEAYDVVGDPAGSGDAGDPLLNAAGNNWFAGNFYPGRGNYHVLEGFVETVVPVLNSPEWGVANLDLGGRATGYSTAGYVNTWKVGATWETPIDGVRLRALQSRDIRAPNLSELYAATTVTHNEVNNDFTGVPVSVFDPTTGNPDLKPEKALTTEIGIIYQPSWLPGFSNSIDYYRIAVKGQIQSFGQQQVVDLCYQGYQVYCSAIVTSPPGGNVATSAWYSVGAQPFNSNATITDGFDFETSYQFTLNDWDIPGNFVLRSLATHVSKLIAISGVPGVAPEDQAGENSGAVPHWKLYETQTYSADKWSINLTETYISDGVNNSTWIQCTTGCPVSTALHPTINNNVVRGAFYLDVGGTYKFDDNWQTYFRIDNVTDASPPLIPSLKSPGDYGFNPLLYDVVGRMYRVGLRLDM